MVAQIDAVRASQSQPRLLKDATLKQLIPALELA
jgi:hypothetical protein